MEDMAALGVRPFDVLTRVTEYVTKIVAFVETIVGKGLAYSANGGSSSPCIVNVVNVVNVRRRVAVASPSRRRRVAVASPSASRRVTTHQRGRAQNALN